MLRGSHILQSFPSGLLLIVSQILQQSLSSGLLPELQYSSCLRGVCLLFLKYFSPFRAMCILSLEHSSPFRAVCSTVSNTLVILERLASCFSNAEGPFERLVLSFFDCPCVFLAICPLFLKNSNLFGAVPLPWTFGKAPHCF